jgi:serine/threonine protein kinase
MDPMLPEQGEDTRVSAAPGGTPFEAAGSSSSVASDGSDGAHGARVLGTLKPTAASEPLFVASAAPVAEGRAARLRESFGLSRLGPLGRVGSPGDVAGSAQSAGALAQRMQMTMTTGVGSLVWMPPELHAARKNKTRYGPSMDVFAFGVILWEIMAQAAPWGGMKDAFAVREAVNRGRRPRAEGETAMRAEAPMGYCELMDACWHQDMEARPSFEDCFDILERMLVRVAPDGVAASAGGCFAGAGEGAGEGARRDGDGSGLSMSLPGRPKANLEMVSLETSDGERLLSEGTKAEDR